MKKLVCAASAALAMASTAFAAPITFTFTSVSADLDFASTVTADLVITLSGDTANYQPTPLGPFGSNRYLGLSGTVSSTSLGLSNVALLNTLDLLIGADPQDLNLVALSSGSGVVGITRHPSTVGDLISNWDRVSNFSASQMQTLTDNGFFTLIFANGASSVNVYRIDGISGAGVDGGFSATLVTTPGTVPEPTAPALVLMALAAGAMVTRRRRAG